MDLKTCRKRHEWLKEMSNEGAPIETIKESTLDYYEDVLREIYDATLKNGGSWTNSLAAIALGLE